MHRVHFISIRCNRIVFNSILVVLFHSIVSYCSHISMAYGILWNGKSTSAQSYTAYSNGLMLSVFILSFSFFSVLFWIVNQWLSLICIKSYSLSIPKKINDFMQELFSFSHINALNRLQKYANRFFSFPSSFDLLMLNIRWFVLFFIVFCIWVSVNFFFFFFFFIVKVLNKFFAQEKWKERMIQVFLIVIGPGRSLCITNVVFIWRLVSLIIITKRLFRNGNKPIKLTFALSAARDYNFIFYLLYLYRLGAFLVNRLPLMNIGNLSQRKRNISIFSFFSFFFF